MKRQYTAKGLQTLAATVQESVKKARDTFVVWSAEMKELDGAKAKATYKPEHLVKLKAEKQRESQGFIQATRAEMRRVAGPALSERGRWSKESYIRESPFVRVPETTLTKEDKLLAAVAQLTDTVSRMQTAQWLSGLDDDGLAEAASEAATSADFASLGTAIAEARRRKSTMLELKIKSAIDSLSLPEEVTLATTALEQIDLALQEADVLEAAMHNPNDTTTAARVAFFKQKAEQQDKTPEAA
jgi:hypothetical protein